MMRKPAAFVAVALLGALGGFQVALAAGLPAAEYAWGGQFSGTLPVFYRWASLAAVPMLAVAAWVILARADIARPGSGARPIRIAAWAITAFLTLNAVGNLMSASALERQIMTPLALVLLACCATVAVSKRPASSP
jgi:hypothetical protein